MPNTTSGVAAAGTVGAMPLLSSIILTGLAMAAVIVWQGTGLPVVGLLFVPWLLSMVGIILAGRQAARGKSRATPSDRPPVMADGLAVQSGRSEQSHASTAPVPQSLAG